MNFVRLILCSFALAVTCLAEPGQRPVLSIPPTQGGVPVLAILQLDAPSTPSSVLRATLPLPRGAYIPKVDDIYPLVLRQDDGELLLPQVDVVARYAEPSDGASVVRITARLASEIESNPGQTVRVEVLPGSVFNTLGMLPPGVAPSTSGTTPFDEIQLSPKVLQLLMRPSGLISMAVDPFGNLYSGTLIGSSLDYGAIGDFQTTARGHVMFESRRYVTMTESLNSPSVGEPLPHHFGVHAYVRAYAGFDFVTVDLRFNNGASDLLPGSALDNALGDVYFRDLNLIVPAGWKLLPSVADQAYGQPVQMPPGYSVQPLAVNPAGGKFHVLPRNGQLHRRLVMVPAGDPVAEAAALAHVRFEGLAFASAGSGAEAPPFSWSSPLTKAYFSQQARLPRFDHIGKAALEDKLRIKNEDLLNHLAQGTSGSPPLVSGAVGWAHPYGQKYGGITGGFGIHLYEGVPDAWAASRNGIQHLAVLHRMQSDRQRNVIYDFDGSPATLQERLVSGPSGLYFPGFFYMEPLPSHDPFNYNLASTAQVDYVEANGLAAPSATELLEFSSIDLQHLVRYTRAPKTLAWLVGDPLAKDDILGQAALVEMSYHNYPGSASGAVQSTTMLADQQYTAANPGIGFPFGRGEGWAVDTMATAFALTGPQWRNPRQAWFDTLVEVLDRGQALCSGFIQAQVGSKLLNGKYRARQTYEGAIVDHSLMGVLGAVYSGTNKPQIPVLTNVLIDSLSVLLDDNNWDDVRQAPYEMIAVGPLDESQPLFCNGLPADGFSDSSWDLFQSWSSFGYGFELTGNPAFLTRAEQMIGSSDLLTALEQSFLQNVENRIVLISTMQDL